MIARGLALLFGLLVIGMGAYLITMGATGYEPGLPYPNSQHISTTPTPKGNR